MPEYLSPGVYVEEVDRGPKPIEGVGTAMAAFVGFTAKAEITREIDGELITQDLLNRPQLVTNWTQYVERYGEFVPGAYLSHAVYGYFMNGGTRCYVVSVRTIPKAQAMLLNSEGKPQLSIAAKQAGFEGLRLRVKVEDSDDETTFDISDFDFEIINRKQAEMLIAVTDSDEVNLLAAFTAKKLGAKKVVARVRNRAYLDTTRFNYKGIFSIIRNRIFIIGPCHR